MWHIWFLLLLAASAVADSFLGMGCFRQADLLSVLLNKGAYIWQTSSYCQIQCAGSKVAALLEGKYCYCGLTVPLGSMQVDLSKCNTPCQGYGSQTCGGSGYFYVYVNADVDGSTMAGLSSSSLSLPMELSASQVQSAPNSESQTPPASSSAVVAALSVTTSSSSSTSQSTSDSAPSSNPVSSVFSVIPSTTSSSSTSTSSSSSSTTSSTTSTSSTSLSSSSTSSSTTLSSSSSRSTRSGSIITLVSTVTSEPSGTASASVVEVTTTVSAHALESPMPSKGSNKSKLSGGGIAGVVVGTIAGVVLLSGLVLLILWRRRQDDDDDEKDDFFNKNYQEPGFDSVRPNPLMAHGLGVVAGSHAHNNSNTTPSYLTGEDGFIMEAAGGRDATYAHNDFMRPPNEDEFGRRRLSNGSLPDMANRTQLKVVNY